MRSLWRTLDPRLVRDVGALAAAIALVGASFGAITVASGNPVWVPIVMSLLVFAGGAQFMAVGIVASGGSLVAAVVAGLLLNLRMLPFGMAIGDVLGKRRTTRLIGSHLVIDESVAFALTRTDSPVRSRQAFWLSGLTLFVVWNVAVVVGALGSTMIGSTDAFGIDAAFPAGLLALVLPALRDPETRRAALVGTVVALATTPFLPPGIPVLLGLTGVLTMLLPLPRSGRPGNSGQPGDSGRPGSSGRRHWDGARA